MGAIDNSWYAYCFFGKNHMKLGKKSYFKYEVFSLSRSTPQVNGWTWSSQRPLLIRFAKWHWNLFGLLLSVVGLFPAEFRWIFGVFNIWHFLFIFEGKPVAFSVHGFFKGVLFAITGVVQLLWWWVHVLVAVWVHMHWWMPHLIIGVHLLIGKIVLHHRLTNLMTSIVVWLWKMFCLFLWFHVHIIFVFSSIFLWKQRLSNSFDLKNLPR